jgi:ribosomal subunit interface protein
METKITARHGEIAEDLKERAEVLVERLALRTTRPTSAHVTFVTQRSRAEAEIVLNAARGVTYVAKAEADDARTALDRVAAKLQRQLDKADVHPARRATRKVAS